MKPYDKETTTNVNREAPINAIKEKGKSTFGNLERAKECTKLK